jgi:ATP-independent RNA helicase DbpA
MNSFSQLSLSPPLVQGLEALAYTEMTPIQAASLPPILENKDVIAQAKTGSGKTAAFGLGLLSRLDPSVSRVQALVLCPTRELADQVSKELRRLARFIANIKILTLCGGISLRPQIASLVHEPHIVVGTPGRIQELLDKEHLSLDAVKVLVLDEADRMLDMGFAEAIADVIAQTPADRQTLLFSATYADEIRSISKKVQRDPVQVTVDSLLGSDEIEQMFYEVELPRKVDALAYLLNQHRPESALVFCNTKRDTQDVADQLAQRGFSVLALNGDLEQRDRDEVLVRFANKSCSVLVATDVAARGLDIKELPAVVSFELPSDPEIHVHRIGRTARAGNKGLALNLCSSREIGRVPAIEAAQGSAAQWGRLNLSLANKTPPLEPPMVTLIIDGGRQDKLRPGDIMGAVTGDAGLPADAVGKIDTFATRTYVAIKRAYAQKALEKLRAGKIKGRSFRVRK